MKEYTENDVVRRLNKKRDVKIIDNEIIIYLSPEIGNGTWGKIDFLVNHRGYTCRIGENRKRSR